MDKWEGALGFECTDFACTIFETLHSSWILQSSYY